MKKTLGPEIRPQMPEVFSKFQGLKENGMESKRRKSKVGILYPENRGRENLKKCEVAA